MPVANGTPDRNTRRSLDATGLGTQAISELLPSLLPQKHQEPAEDALLLREAEFQRRGYRVRITNTDGKQWYYPPEHREGGTLEQAKEWQERWDKVRYPTEKAFEIVDQTMTPYVDKDHVSEEAKRAAKKAGGELYIRTSKKTLDYWGNAKTRYTYTKVNA